MEFTVYRQAFKIRPGGQTIYKGEDARPFVGKDFLLVADGLGGAAAIRHINFNRELFEEDKLLDVLCHDVFDNYTDEEFSQYMKDSFFEFLSIRDCYFDTPLNIKKSGYFASRLVAAIMLNEVLISGKDYYENGIFDEYDQCREESEKAEFIEKKGKYFADLIRKKLKKMASNANFFYESAIGGMALLGTTVCATIFRENSENVEAFYLVAGDSRPYMWNESGLYQVMEDQERPDGGMTNCIKANEDSTFGVECSYRKFDKPCILFNASDGCFDSKYFLSQLAFEKLILETICASQTIEEVGTKLQTTFEEYGRHDDSSTIALKAFGFGDDYAQLRTAAQNRLNAIQEQFLTQLPELLDRDFESEYQKSQEELPGFVNFIQTSIERLECVTDYCKREILAGGSEKYNTQKQEINCEVAKIEEKIISLQRGICKLIEKNYIPLAQSVLTDGNNGVDEKTLAAIETTKEKYNTQVQSYKNAVNDLKETVASLPEGESFDSDIVESSEGLLACLSRKIVENSKLSNYKQVMNRIYSALDGIKSHNDKIIKSIQTFYKQNRAAAKNNQDNVMKIYEKLHSEKIGDISQLLFLSNSRDAFDSILTESKGKMAEKQQWLTDKMPEALQSAVPNYRLEHSTEIARGILDGTIGPVSDENKTEIQINYNAFISKRKKQDEVKQLIQQQKDLLRKYDETYYQLIRREDK